MSAAEIKKLNLHNLGDAHAQAEVVRHDTELLLAESLYAANSISLLMMVVIVLACLAQAIAFETDAYAIMDTLAYIRPKVYTLVIGQAFGNAAMIVASGAKGCRFATPNSRLMTAPPRINRNFGTTKNIMIRANELENNTQVGACSVPAFAGALLFLDSGYWALLTELHALHQSCFVQEEACTWRSGVQL